MSFELQFIDGSLLYFLSEDSLIQYLNETIEFEYGVATYDDLDDLIEDGEVPIKALAMLEVWGEILCVHSSERGWVLFSPEVSVVEAVNSTIETSQKYKYLVQRF